MTFLRAIGREEGYGKPGTLPTRNLNPGDLEFHPWMTRFGGQLESGPHARFAVFPTEKDGYDALKHLFGFPLYKGKTVAEAITEFAPAVENRTAAYIANVCAWAECQPTDIIDGLVATS